METLFRCLEIPKLHSAIFGTKPGTMSGGSSVVTWNKAINEGETRHLGVQVDMVNLLKFQHLSNIPSGWKPDYVENIRKKITVNAKECCRYVHLSSPSLLIRSLNLSLPPRWAQDLALRIDGLMTPFLLKLPGFFWEWFMLVVTNNQESYIYIHKLFRIICISIRTRIFDINEWYTVHFNIADDLVGRMPKKMGMENLKMMWSL